MPVTECDASQADDETRGDGRLLRTPRAATGRDDHVTVAMDKDDPERLTLEDITADNGRRYVTMELSLTGGVGTEPR
ncbi:MAG: hypothetical protein U5K37_08730 [Natrialbaceae archaeon]|nr:hypothetical protein [Natrialbaceae archaeon]